MSASIPAVSVVIPTYNYARYLGEAVESVRAQTFRDVEVIVVDDGSTDETSTVIRRFGDSIRSITQPNLGLSAARNAGIEAARGMYVAFLDSDDTWLPEKLSLQVVELERRPDVGLVYADILAVDDATGLPVVDFADHRRRPSGNVLAALVLREFFVPSPTPLVRRGLLEAAGPFDSRLTASEDWDMWIRIARLAEFAYVDQVVARYRLHRANMHRDADRMKRNRLAVLAKVFSDSSLPPKILQLHRRALSRVFREAGMLSFFTGRYRLARADLLQAMRLCPAVLLESPVMLRMMASLLNPKLLGSFRSLRRLALGRQKAS